MQRASIRICVFDTFHFGYIRFLYNQFRSYRVRRLTMEICVYNFIIFWVQSAFLFWDTLSREERNYLTAVQKFLARFWWLREKESKSCGASYRSLALLPISFMNRNFYFYGSIATERWIGEREREKFISINLIRRKNVLFGWLMRVGFSACVCVCAYTWIWICLLMA
jgi:hypothetical protein